MLENRLEEGQVFKEFEQIPRKSPTDMCDVAARPENKDRNRFKDVHPYDKNRVKLAATKANPTGYINGSHIKVRLLQLRGNYKIVLLLLRTINCVYMTYSIAIM